MTHNEFGTLVHLYLERYLMNPPKMQTERLVWIDLETTDLDETTGSILEVGIAITDRDLKIIALHDWQVYYAGGVFTDALDEPGHPLYMPPEVRASHEASGLIADCIKHGFTDGVLETKACAFIDQHGGKASPMCGSSVHFDRRWLARHMPELHAMFHYRNFDASHYRIEGELTGRSDIPAKPDASLAHRALVDVSNSIDLARWGMLDGRRWRAVVERTLPRTMPDGSLALRLSNLPASAEVAAVKREIA
jgi:oligoribonuclease